MIKKFNDYETTPTFEERPRLPKGAYILKVLNVEVINYDWGSVLKFDFDIAEGEYKDFFKHDYFLQTQGKKWKGSYRIRIPKDDGSENDKWTKMRFKTTVQAFEKSNPGYKWDWDETKLKNKFIGGLFNQKEWEYNGNTGWFTQCKRFIHVEDVRNGNYTLPDDEPLKQKQPEQTPPGFEDGFMNIPDGLEEELPFN